MYVKHGINSLNAATHALGISIFGVIDVEYRDATGSLLGSLGSNGK